MAGVGGLISSGQFLLSEQITQGSLVTDAGSWTQSQLRSERAHRKRRGTPAVASKQLAYPCLLSSVPESLPRHRNPVMPTDMPTALSKQVKWH